MERHPQYVQVGTAREQLERLLVGVEQDLRETARKMMRHERSDHTLQPTALLNEAVRRLLSSTSPIDYRDDAHVRRCIVRTMKRVLIDSARAKRRRGNERRFTDASESGSDTAVFELARSSSVSPLDRLSQQELVQRSMERGTSSAWAALFAKAIAGARSEQIALRLGISEKAVEKKLASLRRRLSSQLEGLP